MKMRTSSPHLYEYFRTLPHLIEESKVVGKKSNLTKIGEGIIVELQHPKGGEFIFEKRPQWDENGYPKLIKAVGTSFRTTNPNEPLLLYSDILSLGRSSLFSRIDLTEESQAFAVDLKRNAIISTDPKGGILERYLTLAEDKVGEKLRKFLGF